MNSTSSTESSSSGTPSSPLRKMRSFDDLYEITLSLDKYDRRRLAGRAVFNDLLIMLFIDPTKESNSTEYVIDSKVKMEGSMRALGLQGLRRIPFLRWRNRISSTGSAVTLVRLNGSKLLGGKGAAHSAAMIFIATLRTSMTVSAMNLEQLQRHVSE
ncbi:hypothetical protein POTOM_048848 [Populus tomentosa]|uniref:Uncharacterized protein n=1 Tax=Populus tomentosa TaxID=118781 RepID=A0A8X8CC33_POPTO|nr:hypothetical protein POTOM_048848 [Populus tomentosa]